MNYKQKICKGKGKGLSYGCGKLDYIFAYGLCRVCYVRFKTENNHPNTLPYKDKKHPKILSETRNKGSQKILFDLIWNERPKVSEVSGKPLLQDKTHPKFYWQFSHILSKGAYPKYKALKENIKLVLPEEHELWEHKKHLLQDKEEWKWVFCKSEELKERYFK